MTVSTLNLRWQGRQDYATCWLAMQQFTQHRHAETPDEIWLVEHHPVFTQGQNGKAEHILDPGNIPVVQTDRGGQVTYHGPGQLMIYTLIDLKRKRLNVREFVTLLEQAAIQLLADAGISAQAKCKAPGVYVAEKKISSIGLRVRRGCTYHGMAFNVCLDLTPFDRINPCGFAELRMTQYTDLGGSKDLLVTGRKLTAYLINDLGYTSVNYSEQVDGNEINTSQP